ncbi:Type IV pili component [Paramagnetospirillum kuznetsovii]|uniref:Type IV pili component n=1 Tax=Paramagnetospirillum kuznetsovii TaxID=2053833 RepID=A0A364NV53_9PROT|nr:CpaD family pilus assembly lipoprotein [Paramagnetospirillum kuznetsovii]RAU20942.1 Type IV pili component [Paramagnetospirillum kuznetsovii]
MIRKASIVLLTALATACAADMSEHDPHIAHPLTAEVKAAVAVFDRPEAGTVLSEFDKARLFRLAAESLRRGAGPIVITLAAKPGEEATEQEFGRGLAETLRHAGAADIQTKVVVGGEAGAGVAEVRVPIWVAIVPECGTFERGIHPDYTNAPNSNWGCSLERNRGLMVQNPADLVRAREASGRDANRSGDVLGKYGRGEATGSASEDISAGTTSKVGNASK